MGEDGGYVSVCPGEMMPPARMLLGSGSSQPGQVFGWLPQQNADPAPALLSNLPGASLTTSGRGDVDSREATATGREEHPSSAFMIKSAAGTAGQEPAAPSTSS